MIDIIIAIVCAMGAIAVVKVEKIREHENEDWLSFDIAPFITLKQEQDIYSF